MAFSWSIPNITDDIIIDDSIMNELQTNLDTLSSGCYTHKATTNITYNASHKKTYNGTAYSSRQTATGGSCFIEGTMVLLADGSWKAIETFTGGEKIVGLCGINTVLRLEETTLEDNRVIYTLQDEDIYFTGEHKFWIKLKDGREVPGIMNYNEFQYDRYIPDGLDMIKTQPYFVARYEKVDFATIHGWKESSYKFNQACLNISYPDLKLYALVADGSHTMIANGYLVSAWLSDYDFDYETAKWEPKQVLANIHTLPLFI